MNLARVNASGFIGLSSGYLDDGTLYADGGLWVHDSVFHIDTITVARVVNTGTTVSLTATSDCQKTVDTICFAAINTNP